MIFSTVCNLRDFVEILTHELTRLLQEHGFVGYQQNWLTKDFPISNYLKFVQYLDKEKESYDILNSRFSFSQELKMLKGLAGAK